MKHFVPKIGLLILLIVMTLMSQRSYAQDYNLGQPILQGSGCPAGTASATVSPDGSVISILFDNFSIQAQKGMLNIANARKACSFVLPVSVRPGYNIEALSIDYRGFANLPDRMKGVLSTSGPIIRNSRFRGNDNTVKTVLGSQLNDFYQRQEVQQDFKQVCQNQTSLSFTTELSLAGPQARQFIMVPAETMLTLDSIDAGPAAIALNIRINRCR